MTGLDYREQNLFITLTLSLTLGWSDEKIPMDSLFPTGSCFHSGWQ